jgi:DNA-binding response OmpR family regulator
VAPDLEPAGFKVVSGMPILLPIDMRTLILDDEEPIVKLLARVCESEGHEVLPFTSSAQALLCLATEPVDLLITDLNMPGPDGIVVIREARRLQPEIFTLIITGHAAEYPLAEVMMPGTADVMFKPFHMNELRARLALTERRRALFASLDKKRQELQRASNEMIHGLQNEIEHLRKPVGQ